VNSPKDFVISFEGLKNGVHSFEYQIENSFFDSYGMPPEVESVAVQMCLNFRKTDTMLQLEFTHSGHCKVTCGLCLVPLELPVKGNYSLVVNFGDAYAEPADGLLVLPHGSYQMSVMDLIHDNVRLTLPGHFNCKSPGKEGMPCDNDMLNTLDKYLGAQDVSEPREDPRWAALKKLK
jgi:uncharacterized metal-binding protein YceD (DUF177 family)